MADRAVHRNVEVSDGDRVVASAQVDTSPEDPDTVRASLHAESGHLPVGSRANLVDAVLDLPEVQGSPHLEATVPLGDAESLQRLRERTDDMALGPPAPAPSSTPICPTINKLRTQQLATVRPRRDPAESVHALTAAASGWSSASTLESSGGAPSARRHLPTRCRLPDQRV